VGGFARLFTQELIGAFSADDLNILVSAEEMFE
jgi:hypothetical protein